MKIALLGASGSTGSRLLKEALTRGHQVTALSRHAEALAPQDHMTARNVDIKDAAALAEALRGHDVVVSSVRFRDFDIVVLLSAIKAARVDRLVMVGGAGTLRVASGAELASTPAFPEAFKPEATAGKQVLDTLRSDRELNWTFLSPSALFAPGERTGAYRLGKDDLLVGPDGKSRISQEDFSIALLDEVERGAHPKQRVAVGY